MLYKLIKTLLQFSPRQLNNETRAGKYLLSFLQKNNFPFRLNQFTFYHPDFIKAVLLADGRKIACQPASFVSGKISGKDNLFSSMAHINFDLPHLSFNPHFPDISVPVMASHYPALAISKNDLPKILKAKKIDGNVIVNRVKHQSQNILVGNLTKPQNLIFSHYDSINTGAVDNASGVAVSLKLILNNSKLLAKNLFIFSGNEELSYDFPIYWGHGYRMFEKKYFRLMQQAKKILVVDCVGNDKPQAYTSAYWVNEGFPVKNLKSVLKKTALIAGDLDKLMTVYHSRLDNLSQINRAHLNQAYYYLLNLLK